MNAFIILAFTACLVSAPDQCRERELTYSAAELTIMQCTMGAQLRLAEWSHQHPGWQVRKFRCRVGDDQDAGA